MSTRLALSIYSFSFQYQVLRSSSNQTYKMLDFIYLAGTYIIYLLILLVVGIIVYEFFPRMKSINGKHVVVSASIYFLDVIIQLFCSNHTLPLGYWWLKWNWEKHRCQCS